MEGHPGELHDVRPIQAFPLLVYLKAATAEVRYSYLFVLLLTSAIATATATTATTISRTNSLSIHSETRSLFEITM